MTADVTMHPTTRGTSNTDLLSRLDRIEDKLDSRMNSLDAKLDHRDAIVDERIANVISRLDRMEGGLGMLKWLGPTGVVAVIFALAQAAGLVS